MKQNLVNEIERKTLIFKCKCGNIFISDEYKSNGLYIGEMKNKFSSDKCPKCGGVTIGGRPYKK